MACSVYSSYDPRHLIPTFCECLLAEQRSLPLQILTVLVPNHNTARWLTQAVAQELGVCTQLRFTYLETWLAEGLAEDLREGVVPHWQARAALHWHASPEGLQLPGLPAGDDEALTRLQYAWEMAGLLRRYAELRPDWILNGFSHVGSELPAGMVAAYREALLSLQTAGIDTGCANLALLRAAEAGTLAPCEDPCVFAFGFWEIHPTHWKLLLERCSGNRLHLFLSMPATGFLQDGGGAPDPASLASDDASGPGGGTLPAPKMRALRQRMVARGRKLQSLLLDQQQADHMDIEPEWQPPETLLARVTQCLVRDPDEWELAWMQGTGLDASLQIHSCVSRRRELEVAKARIQEALLADPTLRLSDICIHAPRIEPYRSFIGLVFAPEPRASPWHWTIREQQEVTDLPVFDLALQCIALMTSGGRQADMLALLEHPALEQRFDWNHEAVLTLQAWIRGIGIHGILVSGVDGQEGNAPDSWYSWTAGVRRLLALHILDNDAGIPGSFTRVDDPELLESLLRMLQILEHMIRSSRNQSGTLAKLAALGEGLRSLLPDGYNVEQVQTWNGLLASLRSHVEAAGDPELTPAEIGLLLRKMLESSLPGGHSRAGKGILFSSIGYEDLEPCRVRILLGMEESGFPRRDVRRSFDLLTLGKPAIGDPSRPEQDAWWMLHSLALTRDRWIATWQGQDPYNLEPLPASPLLVALQEAIEQMHPGHGGGEGDQACESMVVTQPRFAWDPACFSGKSAWTHFARPDYRAALSMVSGTPLPPWTGEPASEALPASPPANLSILDLVAFFTKPARYFCVQRIGMSPGTQVESEDEHEPLLWLSNHLESFKQRSTVIAGLTQGVEEVGLFNALQSRGLIPAGEPGRQQLGALLPSANSLMKTMSADGCVLVNQAPWVVRSLEIGGCTLTSFGLKTSVPVIGWPMPRAGVEDHHLLEPWLIGLGLWIHQAPEQRSAIRVYGFEKQHSIQPPEDPIGILEVLLEIFRNWQDHPLPFFPKTSLVACKKPDSNPASLLLEPAWSAEGKSGNGESRDRFVRQVCRGREHPFDPGFFALAHAIYQPLLASLRKGEKS